MHCSRSVGLKGRILACKTHGIILGEDEKRYTFSLDADWKTDEVVPQVGQVVDFISTEDGIAGEVYFLNAAEPISSVATVFQKESMPRWVYGLYTASLVIGITAIIGVVIAYIYREECNELEATHYRWQIRTFWNAFIGFAFAFVLTFVGIGILIFWVNGNNTASGITNIIKKTVQISRK